MRQYMPSQGTEPDGGTTTVEPPTLTADDLLVLDTDAFPDEAVAIVTGAGSGIGRATALALLANGVTVAGVDIDEEGMAETADRAASFDLQGTFTGIDTDLTDDDDLDDAVAQASEIDDVRYLANIAGMQHIAPLADFPMDRYDLLVDLMVRAPFGLAKRVMPLIEETDDGKGAIANMSSVHGHVATRDKSAYITAKHALNGLTRAIAAEGDGHIRGFSVSVGYVMTPLMAEQIAETAEQRGITEQAVVEDVMLGKSQTKRMMTPAEVANLFVFGLSGHGEHLNGGDLLWDGGFTTTYE